MSTPKIAIVTGGSRGIGAASAELLGKAGYAVAVNYARDEAAAKAVVAGIEAGGGKAIAVQGDVGTEADVLRVALRLPEDDAERNGDMKVASSS